MRLLYPKRDLRSAFLLISPGHGQSRVVAGQPSPPSPLSLNGRGGAERILLRNLPSPREGEGQGVRGPELTLLMPCLDGTFP